MELSEWQSFWKPSTAECTDDSQQPPKLPVAHSARAPQSRFDVASPDRVWAGCITYPAIDEDLSYPVAATDL
jgi:hypothetical protein